jgi:tetratricopeptide (TPR) repeat protein
MKIIPRLRYCFAAQRPASAWLLPGGDARQWVTELVAWEVPLAGATLSTLPDPERAGQCLGAIAFGELDAEKIRPQRAIPYGPIAKRVFAPIEATCDPPLSEDDLQRLLPSTDGLYVWHPSAGLLQLDSARQLPVSALLAASQGAARAWNAAQPGVALNQRLFSVQPLVRPTMEQVLDAGRDDIGSRSLSGGTLPQAPGEPIGGAVGRAIARAGLKGASLAAGAMGAAAGTIAAGGAALAGGLAGGLAAGGLAAGLGALAAGTAGLVGAVVGGLAGEAARSMQGTQKKSGRSSLLRQLSDWAQRRREAVEQRLDYLRNRQIERLLNLLKVSPDEGLRFALPLATGNHRGLSAPGWQLVERDVGFSLRRLGGGGPVDPWQFSAELQRRLHAEYRELADREISLGRFRRAAYIFAELLGDLSSAAAALANGGHFREAAILYDERLHQPLAAAKCLERGGLTAEAIALYERLEQWETVGDLYRKIEQPANAERAYRTAADGYLTKDRYLDTARLLEFKLNATDEAHTALIKGWLYSAAARRCLDASFELLARHQRHEEAAARLVELQDAHPYDVPGQDLAAAFAKVAGEYPHEAVRTSAAQATRHMVSRRLPAATSRERESLLASLASLVPADQLLQRDCQRYQALKSEHRALPRSRPTRSTPVRIASWFRLPPAEWKTAVSIADEFYAAGWLHDQLVLVRARWDGAVQPAAAEPWRVPAECQQRAIMLAADPRGLGPLYLHIVGTNLPAKPAEFHATDRFPTPLVVKPHPACGLPTAVLQYGPGGAVLVGEFETDGEHAALKIVPYDYERLLSGHHLMRLPASATGTISPPFLSRGADLFLGHGRWLISKRVRQASAQMPSDIRSITGSLPHTRARIVVGCEQGGVVVWGDAADAPHTCFAVDLLEPVMGINRGGWIAAVTGEMVQIYGTHDGKLTFVGEIEGPRARPLAVLSTDHPARIAVITHEGSLLIYEVAK